MSSSSPQNSAAFVPPPVRFLVAEDDDDLRYIIVRVLTEAYPRARIADFENGKDALADFDRHGAQLVVSNHSMPLMDGPTFVRCLRKRSTSLPIVMVSGSPEAYDEGTEAGISRFIDKDQLMARLEPTVSALLRERGLQPAGQVSNSEVGRR